MYTFIISVCIYLQYISKYHWISSKLGSSNIIQTRTAGTHQFLGPFPGVSFGGVRPSTHPRYSMFLLYVYIYIYRIFHIIMYISGQIILFHQPGFPSNRRFPFQKIYLLKGWGRVRALSQPFLSWPQYWSLAPTKPGTATCDVPPFEAEEMCWNGNPTMGTRNPRFLEA